MSGQKVTLNQKVEEDPAENPLLNKFSQYYTSPMVQISLKDSTPFYVNRHLLIESSDYFKTCLNSTGFKESQEQSVKLDLGDEYYEPLSHYVHFLYSDYVHYTASGIGGDYYEYNDVPNNTAEMEAHGTNMTRHAFLHARIYILGERICSDRLKEVAAKKFKQVMFSSYIYPHPRTYAAYTLFGWDKQAKANDMKEYRDFCLTHPNPWGGKVVTQSVIPVREIKELADLIYQNTPESAEEIRGTIAKYCVSVIEDLQKQDDGGFLDVICENREFLGDMMKLMKNGECLTL